MKIVYDNIIFGAQKAGGISVVWYELISRAIRDGLDVHFIDFADNGNIMRDRLGKLPNVIRTIPSKYKKYFKYFPVFYRSKEPFIFHSSFFRYCPSKNAINVTTVHDFTNELFQTGLAAKKERWIKNRAIKHSDWIICISENTRRDFEKFYPKFPKDHIRVIYNGVSEDFKPISITQWKYNFGQKNYILFVGERAGYKNFNLVVEALKEYEIDLVIVGKPLNEYETAGLNKIKGHWYHLGRVSNQELNILYNGAFCLAYPSEYEGFGLPILEAQKARCPVIAMNGSSVTEIFGDAILLMQEDTAKEIIINLQLLNNPLVSRQISTISRSNSSRFNWELTYKNMLKLYKNASNSHSGVIFR